MAWVCPGFSVVRIMRVLDPMTREQVISITAVALFIHFGFIFYVIAAAGTFTSSGNPGNAFTAFVLEVNVAISGDESLRSAQKASICGVISFGLVMYMFIIRLRDRYRKARGITESMWTVESTMLDDICTTFCCTPFCVIAQMDRTEFDSHSLSDYCCISTNTMPTRSMLAPPDTPGESSLNSAHIHGGKWPTSIFCCFHKCVPVCLMAWCCPCFPLQRIRKSIHAGRQLAEVWGTEGGPEVNTTFCFSSFGVETCILSIFYPIWLFLFALSLRGIYRSIFLYSRHDVLGVALLFLIFCLAIGHVYVGAVRSKYRRARGITENTCFFCKRMEFDDICTSLCCCPCSVIAQMDRTEFEYDGCSDCFEAFAEPQI